MMKRVFTWKMVLLAALFFAGAKNENTSKIPAPQRPPIATLSSKTSIAELKKIQIEAVPIMENILLAMNEKDHAQYVRDFNPSMKSAYTEPVFKKNTELLADKIGKYISKTPWKTEMVNQHYVIYYHAKFTKAKGPVVVRMVLERADDKLLVAFLSFEAPELKDIRVKERTWWRPW
jgi:hypothetical protein